VGGTIATVIAFMGSGTAYFEGVVPHTYTDAVGIPTACVGETGPHIKPGQTFTVAECMRRYGARLQLEWSRLEPCLAQDVTVLQAGALLSWTYNVGASAACSSTLVRKLNAGAPPEEWCPELAKWNKATVLGVKVVLPGLVKRRTFERAMCLGEPIDPRSAANDAAWSLTFGAAA
jgi:lysozyme